MNDTTQTPTEQPDELEAIRARVDGHGIKLRVHWNGDGRYSHEECQDIMGHARGLLVHCRRLLELLDERTLSEEATSVVCKAYAATAEDRFNEIERLQKLLDERDGALRAQDDRELEAAQQAGIIYVGCDTPDALAEAVTSLRRELAEAREKALEEAAQTVERISLECAKEFIGVPITATWGALEIVDMFGKVASRNVYHIRELKQQPNQTDHA